jgi:hypothetical protein
LGEQQQRVKKTGATRGTKYATTTEEEDKKKDERR